MGGQIRTIMCPCGWTTRSQLREANSRYKLHTKYCKFERIELSEFDPSANGIGGITSTRHGNKVQKPMQYNAVANLSIKE
jgi:hypothetical protein